MLVPVPGTESYPHSGTSIAHFDGISEFSENVCSGVLPPALTVMQSSPRLPRAEHHPSVSVLAYRRVRQRRSMNSSQEPLDFSPWSRSHGVDFDLSIQGFSEDLKVNS